MTKYVSIQISRNSDTAKYWIKKGYDLTKDTDNKNFHRFLQYDAILDRRMGSYDSAINKFKKIVVFGNNSGDTLLVLSTFVSIGNLYQGIGKLDSALLYFQKSLQIAEHKNFNRGIAICYNGMGTVLFKKGDYRSARRNLVQATKYFELAKDKHGAGGAMNNLGNILMKTNQFDSAISCFEKSLQLKQGTASKTSLVDSYINLGSAYKEIKNYQAASDYYEQAKEANKGTSNKEKQVNILNNLAELNTLLGNYAVADRLLSEGRKIAEDVGNIEELKYNWQYQFKLDSTIGNYQQAMNSLIRHIYFKDSSNNIEMGKNLDELQTKYETEKKDQEIRSLAQQSEIQSLQLAQQKIIIAGIGMVAMLLLGGGLLVYRQNQLKNKQAVSDIEQKLLRTQMNPHFLFNSLTAIQQYLFQNNPEQAGIYMSKFAKLMRQILEHSREDYIPIDEEISTLENYIQLQQLRFKDRFTYQIELDPSIDPETTKIPPMFAQPFIENAIEHGLFNKQNDGLISIKFQKLNDLIRLEVNDNGTGLSKSKDLKPKVETHKSLATTITKERLSIFNKLSRRKIELVIQDLKEAGGTSVQILLPYQMA